MLAPLLLALAPQSVLEVGGPPPAYAEITDAVAAASDGDVLRIRAGTYAPFVIEDTALHLVAIGPGEAQVEGTVRVRNLDAGRSVVIHGLHATGTDSSGVIVQSCTGGVRLEACVVEGARGISLDGHPAVWALESEDVALIDCTTQGGDGGEDPLGEAAWDAGAAVLARNSLVTLIGGAHTGGEGGSTWEQNCFHDGGRGGAGIQAIDSTAWVTAQPWWEAMEAAAATVRSSWSAAAMAASAARPSYTWARVRYDCRTRRSPRARAVPAATCATTVRAGATRLGRLCFSPASRAT